MALGANFDVDVVLGRTGFPGSAAGALDDRGLVFGMDTLSHSLHLFQLYAHTYILTVSNNTTRQRKMQAFFAKKIGYFPRNNLCIFGYTFEAVRIYTTGRKIVPAILLK
jgi:hypothetical protein